jgi:UDP-galactopyranose mutase
MYVEYPIVVLSHLRWDFVYQRPQQILSRLARRHPVLFIEEPLPAADGSDGWTISHPVPGVTVARPSLVTIGSIEQTDDVMIGLIRDLVAAEGFERAVAWVYTAMAEPWLSALEPALVVYDCMDELSLFLGAPPELLRREAALLERADLVFTGGVSLYHAKRERHPQVSCFPSSVDVEHFAQARPGSAIAEPLDQAHLPAPRLGYFGVIDERLDLALLELLATSHPEWQIVMVGPVVKIEPATLPRHPNIHYLGQRSYAELPAYLSGWDVCLLPFALNEATRFISPTKTLEYMAAERPIVSTRIADVVSAYDHIVYLADSRSFVEACQRALSSPAEERDNRTAAMRAVLARTSWDLTASNMEHLVKQSLAARLARHS